MIIRSLSRTSEKHNHWQQLLRYLTRPEAPECERPEFTHNLMADENDYSAIIQEFQKLDAFTPYRKGGVKVFHEILSFNGDDHPAPEQMEALTREYLQRRAEHQIAYCRIHYTEQNPHIHIMLSPADTEGQRVRLSREEFKAIKLEVEQIQRERFPDLKHSLCQSNQPKQRYRRPEQEARRRSRSSRAEASLARGAWLATKRDEHRREVASKIRTIITCRSFGRAQERLRPQGLQLYHRKGRLVGVIDQDGRRYRFTTLGINHEMTLAASQWKRQRQQQLELDLGRRR